jgi:hypothetical protein
MKKKSVMPLAYVLAIAAVWLMFTRGGQNPLKMDMSPMGKSGRTQTTVSVEAPSADDRREERIKALFQADEALAQSIVVQTVVCDDKLCTMTISVQDDPALARTKIEDLLRRAPWLGIMEIKTQEANPGLFTLIFRGGNP